MSINRHFFLTIFLIIFYSFIPSSSLLADNLFSDGDGKVNTYKNFNSVSELRASIKHYAVAYLGSRYKYTGTTPAGFDCSGFVHFVFKEYGMDLSRSSSALSHTGMRIPISAAQPGDLLFFAVKGRVHHVGIVIKNTEDELLMIHSSTSRGVIIENVWDSAYWRKRLIFAKDVLSDVVFTAESTAVGTF